MVVRDVLDDGETETSAAGRARSRRVYSVEPFEHSLLVGLFDADALVCDGDLDTGFAALDIGTRADAHSRSG